MIKFIEAIGDFEITMSGGFAIYGLLSMLLVAVLGIHYFIALCVKRLP